MGPVEARRDTRSIDTPTPSDLALLRAGVPSPYNFAMREWVSINGVLTAADEARVSAFDSGFLQGIGLFETMRAYQGRVFRMQQHIDRLIRSARKLGWGILPDGDQLTAAVEQVIGATEIDEARVRLTVTTGSLRASAEDVALTIVASASAGARYPDECYTKGVTAIISPYRQTAAEPTTGHKTTSYFNRLAALREAHAVGAFEALWLTPENRVAEGCISSLFLVIDEELVTPPLETPVLPGITRAAVLELAVAEGIPAREETLTLEDLRNCDEAFLASSLMEIVPVVRVGRDAIGNEKIGDTTRALGAAFHNLVGSELGLE